MDGVLKCVLTGGPCAGKTTMVEKLKSLGYIIVPEMARMVLEQKESMDKEASSSYTMQDFQEDMLFRQLEYEAMAYKEAMEKGYDRTAIFCDRGSLDGLAYCRLYNETPPEALLKAKKDKRYDIIFLLNVIPQYRTDNIRHEDYSTALKIQDLIHETYIDAGYKPVELPPVSVGERLGMILSRISPKCS